MRRVLRAVVVVTVLAAAGWYGWRWLFPDDRAQIHAMLQRIADGVSSGASETEMGRLSRAVALRRDFDPEVTVDAGAPFQQLKGRDAILGTAAKLQGSTRNLEITLDDVTIEVDDARESATANLIAQAHFDDGGGTRGFDARELDLTLTHIDGAWVVSTVTLVRTLRRLDQP